MAPPEDRKPPPLPSSWVNINNYIAQSCEFFGRLNFKWEDVRAPLGTAIQRNVTEFLEQENAGRRMSRRFMTLKCFSDAIDIQYGNGGFEDDLKKMCEDCHPDSYAMDSIDYDTCQMLGLCLSLKHLDVRLILLRLREGDCNIPQDRMYEIYEKECPQVQNSQSILDAALGNAQVDRRVTQIYGNSWQAEITPFVAAKLQKQELDAGDTLEQLKRIFFFAMEADKVYGRWWESMCQAFRHVVMELGPPPHSHSLDAWYHEYDRCRYHLEALGEKHNKARQPQLADATAQASQEDDDSHERLHSS